jgi:hypothetical protein
MVKESVTNSPNKIEGEYSFYILCVPADQSDVERVMQASMQIPAELTDPSNIEMERN